MDEALVPSLLVLGGARSGKSGFALATAERSGLDPVFIATATAFDDEMAERIARHRAERDRRWQTIEVTRELSPALAAAAAPDRVVVVDCLTLWLSTLMLDGADLDAATGELAASIGMLRGPAIFVSNELGWSIVPDNALARRFRDAQGRLNAAMAAACRAVVLVVAGVPTQIKPAAEPVTGFERRGSTTPPPAGDGVLAAGSR